MASISCMQAEKVSLDTSGAQGLLLGSLSLDLGLFGGGETAYTVGGTITGYNGTGLVLQNNGGSNYTVPAGATNFTLPSGIADGSTFSVTVATAPGNPPQQCMVAGGTGTINAADEVGVSISCTDNTWGATTVGANMTGISGAPYLAGGIDNNGKGVIVYTSNTNQNLMWSSVSAPSTLWAAGTSIGATGSAITMLDFDISQNGTGIGIWQRGLLTPFLSAYFNGSAWSSIQNVGTTSHNSLQINMNAAGGGLITAIENSNSLAFKNTAAADFAINIGLTATSICSGNPYDATTSSSGRAAVGCGDAQSYLQLYERVGSSFILENAPGIQSQNIDTSINDSGNILAAYIGLYDSNLYLSHRSGGIWSGATVIENGGDVNDAATAIDSTGNMLVAWYRLSGSLCISRKLAANTSWSVAQCATVDSGVGGKVILAVNDAGYGYVGLMRATGGSSPRRYYVDSVDTRGQIAFPATLTIRRTNFAGHSPPFVLSVNATGQGMWATTDSNNGGTSYFVFAEVLQ